MSIRLSSPARVSVAFVDLDAPGESTSFYERLLSPDEREKADRFAFDRHRRRYTVGRGALRQLLADRLGVDPSGLTFEYGPFGKPRLRDSRPPLWFNVAHSEGHAIVVTTESREVGVDIEVLRPVPDCRSVAERVFSEAEMLELDASADQNRAFLHGWTRKEAYVKAIGLGLGAPLRGITVSLSSVPSLLSTTVVGDRASDWMIVNLQYPSCVAALAVRSREVDVAWCGWYAPGQVEGSPPRRHAGTAEA
jgi:4'-phosphopantetheinyl transferase